MSTKPTGRSCGEHTPHKIITSTSSDRVDDGERWGRPLARSEVLRPRGIEGVASVVGADHSESGGAGSATGTLPPTYA